MRISIKVKGVLAERNHSRYHFVMGITDEKMFLALNIFLHPTIIIVVAISLYLSHIWDPNPHSSPGWVFLSLYVSPSQLSSHISRKIYYVSARASICHTPSRLCGLVSVEASTKVVSCNRTSGGRPSWISHPWSLQPQASTPTPLFRQTVVRKCGRGY